MNAQLAYMLGEIDELPYELHNGDCLEVLRTLPDNSVDGVVTDPPYGLSDHKPKYLKDCLKAWLNDEPYLLKSSGFMGKSWDSWVPGPEVWKEVLRVLKPGGHALVFAGSRSQDLMGIALRLAGFELRDCIQWVYGSGFPKSRDVSKDIDRMAGAEREVIKRHIQSASRPDEHAGASVHITMPNSWDITAPATDAAKQFAGYGSALKPAYEPILLVRKPLCGTLASNALEHGTGGLNIDGCRVEGEPRKSHDATGLAKVKFFTNGEARVIHKEPHEQGRFPANLIHDGSAEVLDCFPETGASKASYMGLRHSGRNGGLADLGANLKEGTDGVRGHDDNGGSAARFFKSFPDDDPEDAEARRLFYCAKASKKDRDEGLGDMWAVHGSERSGRKEGSVGLGNRTGAGGGANPYAGSTGDSDRRNHHPTVKPTSLCRYLTRLIAPPGNPVIIDPFMGSGSTGKACMLEGFRFIGIEKEPEYFEIAKARIEGATK